MNQKTEKRQQHNCKDVVEQKEQHSKKMESNNSLGTCETMADTFASEGRYTAPYTPTQQKKNEKRNKTEKA